ncbi:MAG: T9SS type A sorting domain-containing protein [Saprospiraceae bacterium]|nr:T9SS type A sorting domain-containing protein [Saprospiraceae bacterium]
MKKILVIITALLFFFVHNSVAQGCIPGGIAFYSQEEIDNFHINYPGCTEIEGTLELYGEEITNLDGLLGIKSIEGDLSINYTTITSLKGLDSLHVIGLNFEVAECSALLDFNGLQKLDTIGGAFMIWGNPLITDFAEMESLRYIGVDCDYDWVTYCNGFQVNGNESLINFHGLENVTALLGDCEVMDNPSLISFSGLDNIIDIDLAFYIYNNPLLSNFEGLNNLKQIGDWFHVLNNNSLLNFTGLDSLEYIGGSNLTDPNPYESKRGFRIANNPELINFNGLEKLNKIGTGGLTIENNNSLINLQGLSGFEFIGINFASSAHVLIKNNASLSSLQGLGDLEDSNNPFFIFQSNPNLSICDISPVCAQIASSGHVIASGNASGCNSVSQIDLACQTNAVSAMEQEDLEIQVFPNPCFGKFLIKTPYPVQSQLFIYDHSGTPIIRASKVEKEIDLSSFPDGLYFISIFSEGRWYQGKVVKQ